MINAPVRIRDSAALRVSNWAVLDDGSVKKMSRDTVAISADIVESTFLTRKTAIEVLEANRQSEFGNTLKHRDASAHDYVAYFNDNPDKTNS